MAKSCGSGTLRLVSSSQASGVRATVAKVQSSPRRARISPKTTAQGKPDASASPVCSCAAYLYPFAHETAGAACTRLSLRPLFERARSLIANLGRSAPRDRESVFVDTRRLKIESVSTQDLSSPGFDRATQYSRDVKVQSRSRGVLDRPLSRATTGEFGATALPPSGLRLTPSASPETAPARRSTVPPVRPATSRDDRARTCRPASR